MADLYRRYAGYLTAVVSRYVSDRDDVKDILQTSFVKIFTSMDRFEYRGNGSVKAWMTRITVNETLKFLKRDEKFLSAEVVGIPDSGTDEVPDADGIPAAVIQDMISRLPQGYRTVFNLYVFEEKSHKEIAALLGISEGTSASQFHRAKAMLATKIREYRKRNE